MKTRSEESTQLAAQASTQDNAAAEPTPAPTVTDHAAECKDILAQMQTAKEPLYGELKNKFGSLNCDLSQSAGPIAPPDSATVCKNLRSTLANMDPNDAKYPSYVEEIATYCPAKP